MCIPRTLGVVALCIIGLAEAVVCQCLLGSCYMDMAAVMTLFCMAPKTCFQEAREMLHVS